MNPIKKVKMFLRRLFPPGGSEFLCDTCKYDHPSACHRPERPNARVCPGFTLEGT